MAIRMTLRVADTIASGAIAAARRNRFAPITATVLDPSGHVVVQKRMDGCTPIAIPDFAHAKAATCIGTGVSSRAFRDKYASKATADAPDKYCQMLAMVNITGGKMAPFPGGVLLKGRDGSIVGAVGVSGASGDEDEYCALQGVRSLQDILPSLGYTGDLDKNCVTDPATHSCTTINEH
jgi:uncharacterized protein GlcG (DUF336 family)